MENATTQKPFTAAQQAAIQSTGISLCVAGPGSGKTAVSVAYIVNKVKSGQFDPSQIVAATFGRKARAEIRARLAEQLDPAQAARVSVVTLHALCKLIITPYREWLGFDASRPLNIVSAGERDMLLKRAMSEVRHVLERDAGTDQMHVFAQLDSLALAHEIAAYKSAGLLPEVTRPIGPRASVITAVYARLQANMRERNKADFDDLQLYARKVLAENADAREFFRATWPVLVLDEAQDINEIQYGIVSRLLGPGSHALVVGDMFQTIYAFRGALGGEVFNRLQADRPDAHMLVLPHNHRNAAAIMATSEALLELPAPRQTATRQGGVVSLVRTGSGYEEALFIVGQIGQIVSSGFAQHGDIAVLCRTNEMVAGIEKLMMEQRVPYAVAGAGSFFEQPEVEQMMAYLRLTQESDAHALRQIANVPERGLKRAELDKLRGGTPELLVEHVFDDTRAGALDARARQGLNELRRVLEALCELKHASPQASVKFILEAIGMQRQVDQKTDVAHARAGERMHLLAQLAGEHTTIPEFLEDLELMSGEDPLAAGADQRVQLMSLHRAKGLEFKVVFVPGVEENLLPLSGAKQTRAGTAEERRLMYVGLTRAEDAIVMTYARTRGGTSVLPSSFLSSLGSRSLNILRQAPAWAGLAKPAGAHHGAALSGGVVP